MSLKNNIKQKIPVHALSFVNDSRVWKRYVHGINTVVKSVTAETVECEQPIIVDEKTYGYYIGIIFVVYHTSLPLSQ